MHSACCSVQFSVMHAKATETDPAPAFGAQAHYYDDAAAMYADPKIRLHYPSELFERVYAFAGGPYEAALDVATGTGQCARQLASKYKQVGPMEVTLTTVFPSLHVNCTRAP